ncbi:hypothetical protein [Paraburkholderia sediminicola]|uniref:hypothetical protein n=1 Tax=Paraburkholderia sediminicola TaxID=458836 RepID=UPI0038B755B2
MQIGLDALQDQIPAYLTKEQKEGLVRALEEFPRKIDYYIDRYQTELLQGDGWNNFDVIRFETGDRKVVHGIVLSNSCDVDQGNDRAVPPRLVFAPLIPLEGYVALLKASAISAESIEGKLLAIREQRVTSIFYLPQGGGLDAEHIVLLDNVHTVPLDHFLGKDGRTKLFTLGMTGFYLFLFKLSVHFCRFHENVLR